MHNKLTNIIYNNREHYKCAKDIDNVNFDVFTKQKNIR